MCKIFERIFSLFSKKEDNVVEEIKQEPILSTTANTSEKISNIVVLIDNGHGVDTLGKKSPYSLNKIEPAIEFEEWKWNREIADSLVKELCSLGYDSRIIVPEKEDIPLKERVNRVNALCDTFGKDNVILISIHSNAAGNGTKWLNAKGWCAYTTKGVTESDKLAECLYDAARKDLVGKTIRTDKTDGDSDYEENFYIIKNTKCAAVLTENFFYDNIYDVKFILSDEGKEKIVKTHVDGIINYIKKGEQ